MASRKEIEENFKLYLTIKEEPDGFIRLTDNPARGLTPEQKAILNRKANIMFNNGNINDARRIYTTTGYSDGLTRVGDYFMDNNMSLKALKQYYLAHNKRKAEPIYSDIAKVISKLIEKDI